MKYQNSMLFTLALFLGSQTWAQAVLVEVGIKKVFIPAKGYDDNDTVEAVVDGVLPNSCYNLEKQEVIYNAADRSFTIRQYAVREMTGYCSENHVDDPRLNTLVPFTDTVKLGKLSHGHYTILHQAGDSQVRSRPFEVEVATVTTVDTLPYAMVTNIKVGDIVQSGAQINAEITGILNNSCYELNDKFGVVRQEDVIIVLPTVTIRQADACLMFTRPFSRVIDLGSFSKERYLLHVRSMNGKSLNHVFSAGNLSR